MRERILCAAIWYKDFQLKKDIPQVRPVNISQGIVVTGHRHGHCIWVMACLTGLRTATHAEDGTGDHQQGFLTNTNRFVDRKEALKIAILSQQITESLYGDELYSEDLY